MWRYKALSTHMMDTWFVSPSRCWLRLIIDLSQYAVFCNMSVSYIYNTDGLGFHKPPSACLRSHSCVHTKNVKVDESWWHHPLVSKCLSWILEIGFLVRATLKLSGPFWKRMIPYLDVWVVPKVSNDWSVCPSPAHPLVSWTHMGTKF